MNFSDVAALSDFFLAASGVGGPWDDLTLSSKQRASSDGSVETMPESPIRLEDPAESSLDAGVGSPLPTPPKLISDVSIGKINAARTMQLLGNATQVVVYGFTHCYYEEVAERLKGVETIRAVYTSNISARLKPVCTLEGRRFSCYSEFIPPLKDGESADKRTRCKATLVSLLVENIWRSHESLPLIPVIFCVDVTNSEYPDLSVPENMAKRGEIKFTTHAEIRRAYRMCTDPRLPAKIREIADKMFLFVMVLVHPISKECSLALLTPPWKGVNAVGWERGLAHRSVTRESKPRISVWREKLIGLSASS